nr:restriction endonuclease [Pectobacterium carotovorum]
MDIYVILAIIILLIFIPHLVIRKRKNKHYQKKITADMVIRKISEIEHPGRKIAYLRKIDPYAFEELILTLLQRRGFVIARNTKYSGDGGIDGRFKHEGKVWFVQAKRYSHRIKIEHVKNFHTLLKDNNCNGIFVHTGTTPLSVRRYEGTLSNNRLEIISGNRLLALFDSKVKEKF